VCSHVRLSSRLAAKRRGNADFEPGIEVLVWGIMRIPFLLGRAIFGGFFILNGMNHFQKASQLAGYAARKNVPQPELAVKATGAVLVAGGASILLGFKPKLGAAALIGFLAAVSPVMHDFWKATEPEQRMNESVNFLKNLALAGGALALMGVEEPWPASLPLERRHRLTSLVRKLAA